jgi:hypothetical protein
MSLMAYTGAWEKLIHEKHLNTCSAYAGRASWYAKIASNQKSLEIKQSTN